MAPPAPSAAGDRGRGRGRGRGAASDFAPALPTITGDVVAAALADSEPALFVGGHEIVPLHVEGMPFPEPADALGSRLAGLQRRDHRDAIRGKLRVGGGGAAAVQQRQQLLDSEPSMVGAGAVPEEEEEDEDEEMFRGAADDVDRAALSGGGARSTSLGGGGGGGGGGASPGGGSRGASRAGGAGAAYAPGASLRETVELSFTTTYARPVVRTGPQTSKHGPSATRAHGDRYERHGKSESIARGADFVVPFGGTHPLVVPIL